MGTTRLLLPRRRSAALPWTPSLVQSAASQPSWIPTAATVACPLNSIPSGESTADFRRHRSLAAHPAAIVLGRPTEPLIASASATRPLDQRSSHTEDRQMTALARPHLEDEACAWLQSVGPGALRLRQAAERGAWRTQASFDTIRCQMTFHLPQKGADEFI
jgi:hypothetical protein